MRLHLKTGRRCACDAQCPYRCRLEITHYTYAFVSISLSYITRYVVHAKMEKVRIVAPTGDEGRAGRQAFLHVSFKSEEQFAKIQARALVRKRPRSVRAASLGENRTLQGCRTRSVRSRYTDISSRKSPMRKETSSEDIRFFFRSFPSIDAYEYINLSIYYI